MQNEINSTQRPLRPGKRMLAAWDYISSHPWCSEALIRINHGQQTLDRLIASNMIEIRQGTHDRLLHAIEWASEPTAPEAPSTPVAPRTLAGMAELLRHAASLREVPCRRCKADVGQPCRTTRTGPAFVVTPHGERQLTWIAAILTKYGQLTID